MKEETEEGCAANAIKGKTSCTGYRKIVDETEKHEKKYVNIRKNKITHQ